MVSFSGSTLSIGDESIVLSAPIKQVIELNGLIAVRMETLGKRGEAEEPTYSRNVWGIERDATVRWEIEPAEKIRGEHKPYTNIWEEEGHLWAYNWNGLAYRVDLETGELREHRQMR